MRVTSQTGQAGLNCPSNTMPDSGARLLGASRAWYSSGSTLLAVSGMGSALGRRGRRAGP